MNHSVVLDAVLAVEDVRLGQASIPDPLRPIAGPELISVVSRHEPGARLDHRCSLGEDLIDRRHEVAVQGREDHQVDVRAQRATRPLMTPPTTPAPGRLIVSGPKMGRGMPASGSESRSYRHSLVAASRAPENPRDPTPVREPVLRNRSQESRSPSGPPSEKGVDVLCVLALVRRLLPADDAGTEDCGRGRDRLHGRADPPPATAGHTSTTTASNCPGRPNPGAEQAPDSCVKRR
jgi:hypothetical protein